MIKRILLALLTVLALFVAAGLVATWREPGDLWKTSGAFAGCPSRPSCVSSMAQDDAHRVLPLAYAGDPALARAGLEKAVGTLPGATIEHATPEYLHVVFRSPTMRFRDDLELLVEPSGVIQVRSISRFGYHDMGVNGARVELLRDRTGHLARPRRG